MIRVFIADDHEIIRNALRTLINGEPDMEVCGESSSGFFLLDKAKEAGCDVVTLDISMPGSEGPSLVRAFTAAKGPAVIVFTRYGEDSHAIAYLRAGASAFISKKRSSTELVKAIRRVSTGKRYITPELADYLFEHQIDLEQHPDELLSTREVEVVRLLAEGHRATDIAAIMNLSPSTVNTYVQRVKRKLGVRTAVEIVNCARENGVLG